MDRFPRERIWVVVHATVAVAAGLGVMGLHRNVIHPKFGSFVLLPTVLVDAEVSAYEQALHGNPLHRLQAVRRRVPGRSQDAADYRSRVTDSESAFMCQGLTCPPGYKPGYCVAVCPAGEDFLGPAPLPSQARQGSHRRLADPGEATCSLMSLEFEYGNRSVYDEGKPAGFHAGSEGHRPAMALSGLLTMSLLLSRPE